MQCDLVPRIFTTTAVDPESGVFGMLTSLSGLVSDLKVRQRYQEIIWPLVSDDIWEFGWDCIRSTNDPKCVSIKYSTNDKLREDMEC